MSRHFFIAMVLSTPGVLTLAGSVAAQEEAVRQSDRGASLRVVHEERVARANVVIPEPMFDMPGEATIAGDDTQDGDVTGVAEFDEATSGHGFFCEWLDSSYNMPPHYPYFPPLHGYYYFRPYHRVQLSSQQSIVRGFHGDPRNPYANEVFQRVYAEYETARSCR